MNEILLPATALTNNSTSDEHVLEIGSDKFLATIDATSVNVATTVAAKIQHSHDGTNWFDLVSFTNIAGAAGHEVKQITDSVLPRVRSVVTLSGATKAATVTVVLWFDKRRG